MKEFISMVTSQLGISEGDAQKATGGVLGMIRDKADSGDFSKLLDSLPGASGLLESAGSAGGGGGGLGGLMGKATSALGGGAGGASGVLGLLSSSGLSADNAGSFVSMFLNFAKDKAGPELIEGILGKIPELKALVK